MRSFLNRLVKKGERPLVGAYRTNAIWPWLFLHSVKGTGK